MKAFLEIEYSRGQWNYKFNFVRANESLTAEGALLATEISALVGRMRAATTSPVAAEAVEAVIEVTPEPVVAPEPEPVGLSAAELEAAAADPFAEPVPASIVEPEPVIAPEPEPVVEEVPVVEQPVVEPVVEEAPKSKKGKK